MATYNGLSGLELESHYNPRMAVPDFELWLASHAEKSDAVAQNDSVLDAHYGSHTLQALDIYPAKLSGNASGKAPVHVFIHGGYWRALDKALYRFIVPTLVDKGICTVLINYRLAPHVGLGEIVEDTLESLRWVHDHIEDHGGDPERISLSGHSAGAHLAAMALAHDWTAEDRPADLIKGAALLSGLYDLTPVPMLPVNQEIGLSEEDASAWNATLRPPLFNQATAGTKLVIGVGGNEPSDWIRQSTDFASLLHDLGFQPRFVRYEGENHFSMMEQLCDPNSEMTDSILAVVGIH